MDFDTILDQRAAFNSKWTATPAPTGSNGEDWIAMSVADSDFRTAPVVRDAVAASLAVRRAQRAPYAACRAEALRHRQ